VGNHWHFHPEMELTLFHAGQGTRFVGDHMEPFMAGDLVLLGERLPHYWHAKGASRGISVQWHFADEHPFWAFPENIDIGEFFKRSAHGMAVTGKTAEAVAPLMRELSRCSGTGQLGIFLIILSRLSNAPHGDLRLLSTNAFNIPPESSHQSAMAKAVRYLVANFRDEVRLEYLLEKCRMSRATFARQFKRHSGHSFSGFLNRLRLQAACRELEKSDRSVLDISLACGFPQISFFNRLFRRELKCNPTDYRRQSRSRKCDKAGPA
jgi:AraC-like DNA-binding protein